MQKIRSLIFGLSLLPSILFASDYGNVEHAKVDSIYDGDTFTISVPGWPAIVGDHIGIRVNGVDTPEMHGDCAQEIALAHKAKEFTTEFLNSGEISLVNIQRDKYFRIDADVYVNGKNLAQELINANLGYQYSGGTKKSWCPRTTNHLSP